MNSSLTWALAATLVGSGGSLMIAAFILVLPEKLRGGLSNYLVSFATGSLLGAAFLGLIPETLTMMPAEKGLAAILVGIIAFFLLEKLILWRHCHQENCEVHDVSAPLILIGGAFHNFMDGFAIASSFLVSVPLGISASFGVFTHEIPREIGDFAILLNAGYSKRRALIMNTFSGAAAIPGVLLGYVFASSLGPAIPYVMAIAAASFIYIAVADLIPGLNKKTGLKESLVQVALILAGLGTIILFEKLIH